MRYYGERFRHHTVKTMDFLRGIVRRLTSVDVDEAAERVGCDKETLLLYVEDGIIQGRSLRFSLEEIEACKTFLARRKEDMRRFREANEPFMELQWGK